MLPMTARIYHDGAWQDAHGFSMDVHQSPVSLPGIDHAARVEVTLTARGQAPFSAFCVAPALPEGFACIWKPHLTPSPDMVISEGVFRSPAIIFESDTEVLALIPDLDALEQPHPLPFLMDWTHDTGLYYGVGRHEETRHIYYRLTDQPIAPEEAVCFSFYWVRTRRQSAHARDFRPVLSALWALFGAPRMAHPRAAADLMPYVAHVYGWAFDRWQDVCWQEFALDGTPVGGVVFIVTTHQKPGRGQEKHWREAKSLWNQAWFCSLRSAYGYRLYGARIGDEELMRKGDLCLRFALSAPRVNGFSASYYEATPEGDWGDGHWTFSSNRRPPEHEHYAHLLDNSWTCYWMLRWYADIAQRPELLAYVQTYVAALLPLQEADGSFPAWVVPDTLARSPFLLQSPETAVHAMLLATLYDITGDAALLAPLRRIGDFLCQHILPEGRWEDFETYWSCSQQWDGKQHGQRDARSGFYSHCTFGMYWTAEALLAVARLTGEDAYLDAGERALAEASLYQALCRPHGFSVPTVGGFGVLNCDDEWNDARQSLFALTYLRYYQRTRNPVYRQRALFAMQASFYMMYCPENPEAMALYQSVYPFLNADDYGFHMENYHHGGLNWQHGLGEFTIFDWGNGAAATSLLEFLALEERDAAQE